LLYKKAVNIAPKSKVRIMFPRYSLAADFRQVDVPRLVGRRHPHACPTSQRHP
jgi:hypothetical protein